MLETMKIELTKLELQYILKLLRDNDVSGNCQLTNKITKYV